MRSFFETPAFLNAASSAPGLDPRRIRSVSELMVLRTRTRISTNVSSSSRSSSLGLVVADSVEESKDGRSASSDSEEASRATRARKKTSKISNTWRNN